MYISPLDFKIIDVVFSLQTYCKTVDEAADVIDCLKRSRNDANFDSKCRALLMKKILQETKGLYVFKMMKLLQLTPFVDEKFVVAVMV